MEMIIAIAGRMSAGKTTIANIFKIRCNFITMKFSDPLKKMVRSMGLTVEHTDGKLKETPIPFLDGVTPRQLMQTLGTQWGRNIIDRDLWVMLFKHNLMERFLIEDIKANKVNIVIDDLRFPNELKFLKEVGARLIHVERPGIVHDDHESEIQLPKEEFHHLFINDGTLYHLNHTIRQLITNLD